VVRASRPLWHGHPARARERDAPATAGGTPAPRFSEQPAALGVYVFPVYGTGGHTIAVRSRSARRKTGLRFCLPTSRPRHSSTPCLIDISTLFTFFTAFFA
jgi:hypothetical protein